MPEYRKTDSFKSDYKQMIKNNPELEKSAKKAFRIFQQNPGHPSLYIHRLDTRKGIWGGHITDKYVFTFHKEKGLNGELIYWFRRIGDHTIYDKP
jgi:mRNA-degrading endonuclease YafQ of YafQ-DinJ toxin-antitoxin module